MLSCSFRGVARGGPAEVLATNTAPSIQALATFCDVSIVSCLVLDETAQKKKSEHEGDVLLQQVKQEYLFNEESLFLGEKMTRPTLYEPAYNSLAACAAGSYFNQSAGLGCSLSSTLD